MFYSLLALGFCLVTWLMIYATFAQKWFSKWNLKKNLREKNSRYIIACDTWYSKCFIWYTFPGVVCGDETVASVLSVKCRCLRLLCECLWNMFWGRWIFFLLLRGLPSVGFEITIEYDVCETMYDFCIFLLLISVFIERNRILTDWSFGFKSSDRNYSVRRC